MNEKELKLLTCGTLGLIAWRNCVSVNLGEKELTVKVPFRKIIIPLQDIEEVKLQRHIKYRDNGVSP